MNSRPKTAVSKQSQIKKRLVNLTLHEHIPNQTIQKIGTKHRKIISQKEWGFNCQQYEVNYVKELFDVAQKILITDLSIHYCKKSKILKQISFIEFSQLKMLYLGGNSIKNVEALSNVNAINLERLYLRTNYITSLKPFKKCDFKELKVLDLSQNHLVTLQNLWQNFDLSKVQKLIFYGNKKLNFGFDFVKAQLNYPNINLFWIYSDRKTNSIDKIVRLLQIKGVKNVRISY